MLTSLRAVGNGGARRLGRAAGQAFAGRIVRTGACALAALACGIASAQRPERPEGDPAAMIAPFRITGLEGQVLMTYLRDDHTNNQGPTGSAPGASVDQSVAQFRTEVFLLTHGYIYLPGLLSFDVGAGPVFDWSSYGAGGPATTSRETLYNLSCRATILRDKPYQGTVYYEHLNPTQTVGPAQVLISETDRYGVDVSVRAPATPVPVRVEASRFTQKGRSTEQAIDEQVDQVSVRADRRLGKLGDTQVRLQSTRQDSTSGSTGLPVQSTRSKNDGITVDTMLRLGGRREYRLDNNIDFRRQEQASSSGAPIAQTRDMRFDLNGAGDHSAEWQSTGRYSYSDSRIDRQDTTVNALSASASWRPGDDFFATVTASGDFTRSTQLDATHGSAGASATWQRALPLGRAAATYSASYSSRDQDANAGTASILGERIALPGTALVSLRWPRVVPGSVVVSNLPRTQVYLEGGDYRLSVVGDATRIQRVVGGNIVDGQELLVDYAFDVGGSYGITQSDQSLYLGWNYESYASTYVQLVESRPRLSSGAPTFELNTVRSALVGARADLPLPWLAADSQLGATLEFEDRRETVSPYKRQAYEGYVQAPVPFTERSFVRVGARRNVVEYDYSPLLGVRLTAYDIRAWSQPVFGMEFSLDAHRETDTGMPIETRRTLLSAKASWRVRRFRMNFDLTHTDEWQGQTQRKRLFAQLVLRRDF
jgi:hypothetical protein